MSKDIILDVDVIAESVLRQKLGYLIYDDDNWHPCFFLDNLIGLAGLIIHNM